MIAASTRQDEKRGECPVFCCSQALCAIDGRLRSSVVFSGLEASDCALGSEIHSCLVHERTFILRAHSTNSRSSCPGPPCSSHRELSPVLQVYSSADIPWILLLGQPNPTTDALFGGMRHEGSFPTSRLSDSEQRFVLSEIRQRGFARIPKATARVLLSFPPRTIPAQDTQGAADALAPLSPESSVEGMKAVVRLRQRVPGRSRDRNQRPPPSNNLHVFAIRIAAQSTRVQQNTRNFPRVWWTAGRDSLKCPVVQAVAPTP